MKSDEILGHLYPDYPQVLCLTEHHLNKLQIKYKSIDNYNLGTYCCREKYEKGGVAIYTHKSIQCSKVNIDTYCKEKDIEICAIKFTHHKSKISIITLYRSPTENFDFFLYNLENVLQKLYNPTLKIIICGDINVDYRVENERKKQLNNILHSFNLTSIITFPTRVQNKSATTIDNIFIDPSRFKEYSVIPIPNGLSDHDAQLLTIRQKISYDSCRNLITVRKFNNYLIPEFINKLSNESWDNIFGNEDVNEMFNFFLNDYLRIFNSCFPLQTVTTKENFIKKNWITKGIKISCSNKRKLYLSYRHNPNEETKRRYWQYSKILSNVVKEAKKKVL
jgi:exonuclease III